MKRISNKLAELAGKVLPARTGSEAEEVKAAFQYISSLGKDSPNQWIRRSAEIPGYLFKEEHEFILEQAAGAPAGDFLEIGAWFGKSTSLLAGAVADRGRDEKVFSVDPFTNEGEERDRQIHAILHGQKNVFPAFVENAKRLGYYDQVIPVATLSTIALPAMNLRIGFAFIDGAHDEASVYRDFGLVKEKLAPGARVLFHDAVTPDYPGVMRAIESVLRENPEMKRAEAAAGTIVALEKARG